MHDDRHHGILKARNGVSEKKEQRKRNEKNQQDDSDDQCGNLSAGTFGRCGGLRLIQIGAGGVAIAGLNRLGRLNRLSGLGVLNRLSGLGGLNRLSGLNRLNRLSRLNRLNRLSGLSVSVCRREIYLGQIRYVIDSGNTGVQLIGIVVHDFYFLSQII